MNKNELALGIGKEYKAYKIDNKGNEIDLDTITSNIYIDIAKGNDSTVELSFKKSIDGTFKIYKMKRIKSVDDSDKYKYLKRVKNRNKLHEKLKKLGR